MDVEYLDRLIEGAKTYRAPRPAAATDTDEMRKLLHETYMWLAKNGEVTLAEGSGIAKFIRVMEDHFDAMNEPIDEE